jgi:hypothetical protein
MYSVSGMFMIRAKENESIVIISPNPFFLVLFLTLYEQNNLRQIFYFKPFRSEF